MAVLVALFVRHVWAQQPSRRSSALAAVANQSVLPATVFEQATPAPAFTLTDQWGHTVSLQQFRGKVVVLAFVDSQCTTVCPLTTESMVGALHLLGSQAAAEVQLLGIDANPQAISRQAVYAYSEAHGLLHRWEFLTGTLAQLQTVWKAYGVDVSVEHDAIDHTPALFVIGPHGRERAVFLTQLEYNAVGAQTAWLARAVAAVLPHPTRQSARLLQQPVATRVPFTITVPARMTLPQVSAHGFSGSLTLAPGRRYLLVFWAPWLQEFGSVADVLHQLNRLVPVAAQAGVTVVAVDEWPTEPDLSAVKMTVARAGPLDYPVVVDRTGGLAAALQVQDLSWYALLDAQGRVIWSRDGGATWENLAALRRAVLRGVPFAARG
ncbi:MAG: SCO family protein [Firmicutes bacterium]|nr:SCO family protein [Alicyclobacillaceae bacterium]MCL6498329.1 SCO family protein [Bacillota bacterium]